MTVITGSKNGIVITGDIETQISLFNKRYLACSDGTLLSISYDHIWRFLVIYKGSLFDKKEEGIEGKCIDDIVYFKEGILWITFCDELNTIYNVEAR